jgi:RHS repeat-associated protein
MVALGKPWRRHSAFQVPRSAIVPDAWDRLVKVHADDGQGGQGDLVATYSYDGTRRRIRRAVEGAPDVAYDYFYSGYQVVEVRKDQSASPYEQYVWGVRYVHSPVCRWYDADADGQGVVQHYYLNDANFNVTALIESDGDVAERVAYDPYGKATFYDEDWENPSGESALANTVLFTGHRLDPESGCYNTLWRYYHPTLGRWVSLDSVAHGRERSLYVYAKSSPLTGLDPLGRWRIVEYDVMKPWITLCAQTGDSWEALALERRLVPYSDIRPHWARHEDLTGAFEGSPVPGRRYLVANWYCPTGHWSGVVTFSYDLGLAYGGWIVFGEIYCDYNIRGANLFAWGSLGGLYAGGSVGFLTMDFTISDAYYIRDLNSPANFSTWGASFPIGGIFSVGATKTTIDLQQGNRARCTTYSWILSVGSPITYARGEGTVRAAQDPSRSGDWF